MSIKIEFHVLQSFPPANLNRDDTNMPKDCEFGGVRRARISSQCIKRSIRLHPDFANQTRVPVADRTRRLIGPIQERLILAGKSEEESIKAASAYVDNLLGGLDKKKDEEIFPRSKVLFYVSEEEMESMTKEILKHWDELDDKKVKGAMTKAFVKQFQNRTSAPDIALFGRMLAIVPKLGMEASCQVAHAISTHRVNMEMDFFTAVDDLQSEEDTGSAMMGVTGFNSATFYRYAAIDWGQLLENLGNDVELAWKTVAGFAYALAKAVPTGKQNAFAAQTPPALILAVVREDGQAWSLANAFEKPIKAKRDESILNNSIMALDKHWNQLNRIYGDPAQPVRPFVLLMDEDCQIEYLKEAKVNSLIGMVDDICNALPQE